MMFEEVTFEMTKDLPGKKGGPLFLTKALEVIEAPTLWVNSFSDKSTTRDTYSRIIKNFLQWLDDEGDLGAAYWQMVDQEIIEEYISYLLEQQEENDDGAPNDGTIDFYIGRIEAFYKWAQDKGYRHFWEVNREKVTVHSVRDQYLLGKDITVERRLMKMRARQIVLTRERERFVDNANFEIAQKLLAADDMVYRIIADIIRCTALRPKDLESLPFYGTGVNKELRNYPEEEWAALAGKELYYEFDSKGKRRSIPFPGDLWAYICEVWMPLRRERAALYKARTGVPAPNNLLFINKDGLPVSRKMITDHFLKVVEHPEYTRQRFNARMLRHSFATYAVLTFLQQKGWLGRSDLWDAAFDEWLRNRMGHNAVRTTYEYYVQLVNAYQGDDLIVELKQSTSALIAKIGLKQVLDQIADDG